jgi:hypothetical protein
MLSIIDESSSWSPIPHIIERDRIYIAVALSHGSPNNNHQLNANHHHCD